MSTAMKPITIDGVQVYVEVDELDGVAGLPATGGTGGGIRRGIEPTSVASKIADVGDSLRSTIKAVVGPVQSALKDLPPDEWTMELNIGFKGEAGVPCITKGEANASVKLTAKWKKAS